MSDLFTMLNRTIIALDTQRYGMDVAGQNIANVNTPGYVRRSAVLAEQPPPDQYAPGGGVSVQALVSARAPLVEARLRYEQPLASREAAIADQLSVLEAGLGQAGASLDAALSDFYNTYSSLAQSPTSSTARQQVIVQGQTLGRAFNDMASRLESQRRSADAGIRADVEQLNALAGQLVIVNRQIAQTESSYAQGLYDQQSSLVKAMSELADVNVINHENGVIDVTIGSGRALVMGDRQFRLNVSSDSSGYATLISDGAAVATDVTSEITGGSIGGLLHVRDTLIPSYTARLDDLAYRVSSDVNAIATSGYDLDGNAGTAFFTPLASAAGAATLFTVNASVVANNRLVVTSSTSAAGNNDLAVAIGRLQDQPMTGSISKPLEGWGNLVYAVASDSANAQQSRDAHAQVVHQLQNLWDQMSGVSIDEEAAMLMRFQTAYQANAKFFQAVDDTLQILLQLGS